MASLALVKESKEVEHAGDKIAHYTLETFHKTFITPIDREEIRALVSGLDNILDHIDAASQWLLVYEIAESTPEVQEMGEVLLRATKASTKRLSSGCAGRNSLT